MVFLRLFGSKAIYDVAGEGFKKKIESNLNELEQNRLLRNEALTFIKSDPAGFVIRTAVKFFYFWWFAPQAGLFYPPSQFFLYKVWYLAIILPAVCGLAMMLRQGSSGAKRQAVLALIYFISISFVQSLCYVEGRHRLVIEPVLLIFTAYAITACVEAKREGI